jgi:hypothetical protein
MEESYRPAIHEVMEQQTISIAKAGVTTTFSTRTTVMGKLAKIIYEYFSVLSLIISKVLRGAGMPLKHAPGPHAPKLKGDAPSPYPLRLMEEVTRSMLLGNLPPRVQNIYIIG